MSLGLFNLSKPQSPNYKSACLELGWGTQESRQDWKGAGGWGEALPVPKVAPSAQLKGACREELRDGL